MIVNRMQRRSSRKWLTAAAVLAVAVAGGVGLESQIAKGTDPPYDINAEKEALRVTPFVNPPDGVVEDPNPASAIPDIGSAAEIAQVKADLVDNLTRDGKVTINNTLPADLNAAVSVFTAAASVQVKILEFNEAVQWATQNKYVQYHDFRFVPVKWEGVQVAGTSAHAIVWGHEDFSREGVWDESDPIQYDAALSLENGRWKLVTVRARHITG